MKILMRILGAAGLLLMAGLLVYEGAGAVATLLAQAGWVLLWLLPLHAAVLLLDIWGWRSLVAAQGMTAKANLGVLFLIGTVREAVNRLLPAANVGGEILGIRLLVLRGVPGPMAAANIIVELLMTLISQCLFLATAVLFLLRVAAAFAWTHEALVALATVAAVILVLSGLLRYGSVFERLGRIVQSILGESSPWQRLLLRSSELDHEIRQLCRARPYLLATIAGQFAALVAGVSENWLVLRWIGHPCSLSTALILESMTQLVRQFIFVVPAGVGLQEAGLIGIGALLGVAPPTALALSLAKRVREVLFGAPFLLGWQWFETRRAGRRPATAAPSGSPSADAQPPR